MVVSNLNFRAAVVAPSETNSVLIVDANRMLTVTVTGQRFKLVPGRRAEVRKASRGVDCQQPPPAYPVKVRWKRFTCNL